MINIYSKWFAYSILSILTVLIYDLSRKYILDKKIVKVEEMIMFLSIFIGVLGLFHLLLYKRKHNMVNIKRNTLGILFLVAVSAYAFNICYMSVTGSNIFNFRRNHFIICYICIFVFQFGFKVFQILSEKF